MITLPPPRQSGGQLLGKKTGRIVLPKREVPKAPENGPSLLTRAVGFVERNFPGTQQQVAGISGDPLNLEPTKGGVRSFVDKFGKALDISPQIIRFAKAEYEKPILTKAFRVAGTEKITSQSDEFKQGLESVNAAAGLGFAPITGMIEAVNHLPIVGTITKTAMLPFSVGAEALSGAAGEAVDRVPTSIMSQEVKDKVKPGIQEVASLVGMLLTGKALHVGAKKVGELRSKYGEKEAGAIVGKAEQIVAQKKAAEVKPAEPVAPAVEEPKKITLPPPSKDVVYHGTKAKLSSLSEADAFNFGDPQALYGPGLYLTDNKSIAEGYSIRKGVGEKGTVLEGKLKPDIKLLNLDEKLPSEVVKIMEKQLSALGEDIKFDGKRGTEATREFMRSLQNLGMERGEAGEIMLDLQSNLQKLGYEGYRHVGGKITGGAGHNVSIIFDTSMGERAANKILPVSEAAQVPAEVPPLPKGTGETVTPTLATKVEANAVANALTEGFGDLPSRQRFNMDDQSIKAYEIIDRDYEQAKRIAMGIEAPPTDILPESVFVALEKRATKIGDVDTLRDLATKSNLTLEDSVLGARIRTLGERDPSSPVAAIEGVQAARVKAAERKMGAKKVKEAKAAETAKIKEKVKEAIIKKQTWADFASSIQC